ncbi:MAG TPA: indole-3-glycerol-phosphate synthase [Polyangiaceae bacterium LLY-WYZ-15_(1-7)]|nr:indole-3-glycerol-phosphate synthase [Polyangiaceae bacterium LLY-WYZ-15_(1-7)]HJL10615.1 indole-3-glycerol-phosphate synthase [Polyangiaceae bacterium LLY-WYZ-15_(1-7)]HJL28232.1 indole-3-glycerol-phosphate synthase [Polyangiaceae bacterium LLY-WYZ-15_(1-7)]
MSANVLGAILARKAEEVRRRRRRRGEPPAPVARGAAAIVALRRPEGAPPRVIAEVKFRSPSAGAIRPWAPGEGVRVARAYEEGGAAAVSVLADGPGFGGSPLQVRRVAEAVSVPVLFKGFVIDPVQLELASRVGASMVLLLVRALEVRTLQALVREARRLGLEPVVEAANERELDVALATGARIVGVNARDLRTFRVDPEAARRCLERTPAGRVAVFMSGVRSGDDLARVAEGRADAVLVGEGLMREPAPAETLASWLEGAMR